MMELPTPEDLEIMAVKARISMTAACRSAKVTPAVFHRWKSGHSHPTIDNIQKIIDALRAAMANRGSTI
jgi:predicted transcriptional regulator